MSSLEKQPLPLAQPKVQLGNKCEQSQSPKRSSPHEKPEEGGQDDCVDDRSGSPDKSNVSGIWEGSVLTGINLLTLPNELLSLVIAHTIHQDLVHLAMSCKLLHRLAREALQGHQRLIEEMNHSATACPDCWIADFYMKIKDTPLKALYIRALSISGDIHFKSTVTPRQISNKETAIADARSGDFGMFIDEVLDNNVKGCHGAGSISTSVEREIEEAICAFWTFVLPNLDSLSIWFERYPIYDMGGVRAALECRLPAQMPGHRFSDLKHIYIDGGWNTYWPFEMFITCAQIPTVQTLTGVEIDNQGIYGNYSKERMKHGSNVKQLKLDYCKLSEEPLINIVHSMRLRDFRLTRHAREFKVSNLLDALLRSSADSLEYLHIWFEGGEGWPDEKGVLPRFKKLDPVSMLSGTAQINLGAERAESLTLIREQNLFAENAEARAKRRAERKEYQEGDESPSDSEDESSSDSEESDGFQGCWR